MEIKTKTDLYFLIKIIINFLLIKCFVLKFYLVLKLKRILNINTELKV